MLLIALFRGVKWNRDERFLAAAVSGIVRVFAPDTVREEVEEKLQPESSWCHKRRIDAVAPYRERWESRYLSVVRFVTIRAQDVVDPRVAMVAKRDPSDGAFAALVSLLAPCVAMAEDADITDHALATREWEPLAALAGSSAENAAPIISAMFGGRLTVNISAGTIAAIAKSKWWPLVLVALAGGVYLLHRREPITRERLAGWFDAGLRFVAPILEVLEEARAAGEQANQELRAAAVVPMEPNPPLHRLARLVAVTPRSSTGSELTALLQREGVRVRRDRVLQVLRQRTFFESASKYRWQLGHRVGARG